MATKVHMEALSPTMEEGQLVRWLKKEGDSVNEGDVLAEIETDKATMELVARGSGVLRKQMLGEGATAAVGTVIGVIAAADEDIGDAGGGDAPAAPGDEKKDVAQATREVAAAGETQMPTEDAVQPEAAKTQNTTATKPRSQREPQQEQQQQQQQQPKENGQQGGRVKASPLARRLAAESGVELRSVQGTGPGGRITKRDIEGAGSGAAVASEGAARQTIGDLQAAADKQPQPQAVAASGAGSTDVPVSQMRKTIAKRLVTSIGPVPTFYLTIEVDMTRMMELRERLNEKLIDKGTKASVNDFIIKAVAEALRRHPEVNASWGDSVIHRWNNVHIGVAVAVEDGLITPVVKDADRKGVAEISAEVRELAGRAREKKLAPDEYTGSTFSISNLGMFGIDEFTAIINPPESGILAIGRVEEKPVVVNGNVEVQPRMRLTMSCDHRVIDGATGAKFLQTLRGFLEDPMMMIA